MVFESSTTVSDLPARERILLAAHDLFYREGIRATGVDKVIAAAGVTKVTFYRHFPSKHDLIRAFLEYRHGIWMDWFGDAIRRHGGVPGGGLLPLVAVMEEWFRKPIYRGCAFINSVAELGGTLPDVLAICHSHKQDMVMAVRELLADLPGRDGLAQAAAVAIDGAIVRAQTEAPDAEVKESLRSLALVLSALQAASRAAAETAQQ
ncbi:TetR family transcriptional regulator [Methylomonas koyamae]|uniref:TetR family transcriptional regulator n=1 Tax=Methylomonas koyamae TaxID=702114 RepID=A0A177MYR5_9GAMM|nr:TetR/AcrR family transcriptional regulator [Methylomonas koyamae]OAI10846.1 TetR family transcriptional regulator [Methylomonas koyamae]